MFVWRKKYEMKNNMKIVSNFLSSKNLKSSEHQEWRKIPNRKSGIKRKPRWALLQLKVSVFLRELFSLKILWSEQFYSSVVFMFEFNEKFSRSWCIFKQKRIVDGKTTFKSDEQIVYVKFCNVLQQIIDK